MRLLKLAAYALFGYALYEFFRGMMNEETARAGAASTPTAGRGGAQRISGAARRQDMTGPENGEVVETADADGAAMRHRVGRGVVRR